MKVIGIDPGYNRLGVAVVESNNNNGKLLYSSCIITDASLPFNQRLLSIGEDLQEILSAHKPDEASVEKTFFSKNKKTAIAVSEARGVVVYEITKANLPFFEYTPPEIKVATTGYGGSTKKQIAAMVEQLLSIDKKIELDDEYDAIAVALTHISSSRQRV